MCRLRILLVICILLSFSTGVAAAQDEKTSAPSIEELARETAISYVNERLPSQIELYYFFSDDDNEQSLALRYDWSSNAQWVDDFGPKGTDFSGSSSSVFAKGNYVFGDSTKNPSELSEIGAKWSYRWFPIEVANPLTVEQGVLVQKCMEESSTFDNTVNVEACRQKLGFGKTRMKYWYVDIDAHVKVEGDQEFDQRHNVYGFEANLSRSFGEQSFLVHPILTIGVEQVEPEDDEARKAVLASEDSFARIYGKLKFTSNLGNINGNVVKLSFITRYFQELDPDDAIEDADLDNFQYSAVALQIPAALFPGFDNKRNSFVLTYGFGELPFDHQYDNTIEIGFRHNFDFSEFF